LKKCCGVTADTLNSMAAAATTPLLPIFPPTVENLIYSMATTVFDNITPRSQQPVISKADVDYALQQITDTIDTNSAYKYLTAEDGVYMSKLILAIESGMRDVLSDNTVTIADVPAILTMIKLIGQNVNSIHDKKDAAIQIGIHTFLPVIEVIVCLVAQMLLPPAEYQIAKSVIATGFDLLATNVKPLLAKPCAWWSGLGCLFGQPDMSKVH
jgi:hypothetical protein